MGKIHSVLLNGHKKIPYHIYLKIKDGLSGIVVYYDKLNNVLYSKKIENTIPMRQKKVKVKSKGQLLHEKLFLNKNNEPK